jgi:MazG family protein
MQSITPHIIEEAYELVDAIESRDMTLIQEELGDVLLHVAMLSQMAEETKAFDMDDVATDVSDKMVRRHPHVFGDTKADTVDEVWKNWDAIKRTEKDESILNSIPRALPALLQAQKIQKKVSRVGFDWPDPKGAWDKVREEWAEFEEAVSKKEPEHMHEEAGDLLFSMVNGLRKHGIDCEEALRHCNKKFTARFEDMEQQAKDNNQDITKLSLEEQEALWLMAKHREQQG